MLCRYKRLGDIFTKHKYHAFIAVYPLIFLLNLRILLDMPRIIISFCKQVLIAYFLSIHLIGYATYVRVGTITGPETDLMQLVKTIALKEHDIRIKIVEFTDYQLLNAILNTGGVDINIFQHHAFLTSACQKDAYQLEAIGKTFAYPMGLYSSCFKRIADIKKGSTVIIPSDPTNQSRALQLLAQTKLIKLDIDADDLVTPAAIRYNPKQLKFKARDLSTATKAVKEAELILLPANFAIYQGLYPSEHALYVEKDYKKYTTLIVARKAEKEREVLQNIVAAYQDEAVTAYAKTLFRNNLL